jgi:hypothetical protein
MVAVIFSGLLGASCGPLPKPFKHDTNGGATSPFDQLGDLSGVVVAPIENAPPGIGGPIADSVALQLRRANIPATTGGALRDGLLLEGQARTITWGARHAIVIDWILSDRLGAIVDQRATNIATDIPIRANKGDWDAWRDVDDGVLDKAAQTIAREISGLLQQENPVRKTRPLPLLGVASVTGATGDGNKSLQRAFEAVLRRAGLPVAASIDAATVRIHGVVTVSEVSGSKLEGSDSNEPQSRLDIKWIFRQKDGAEIGVMTQTNTVQNGQIATRWGGLAYDITLAAIDGVLRVLRTMDEARAITRP